ncbi:hypothetical protein ACHAXT_009714 [Thalassiosira profunda]
MASPPPNPRPRPPPGAPPPGPPFHARTPTTRRGTAAAYYKPSVHQFTCRGAFHLRSGVRSPGTKNASSNNNAGDDSDGPLEDPEEELEAMLENTFICNGLQTKLRHVADYPVARSKEEAKRWFEGSSPTSVRAEVVPLEEAGDDTTEGGDGGSEGDGADGQKEAQDGGDTPSPIGVDADEASFASYGTTQVNILTVQEVPVSPQDLARQSLMSDPFGGFGGFSGMLNPFGSLFGGFFGGGGPGGADPWFPQPGMEGGDASNGNNGNDWMRGARNMSSRSVSSSTRMDRDEEGRRVVTTVTKTTIVDNKGQKRTETVTTKKHVDEGGRVETKKVVEGEGTTETSGSGVGQRPMPGSPSMAPASPPASLEVAAPEAVPGPAEVAVIATDCLLGVSVADAAIADPTGGAATAPVKKEPGAAGWRKSEYLFRLGRFIPPFMVVNKYYKDAEEEGRRRKEMQKEYDDMRERLKQNRWNKAKRDDDGGLGGAKTPAPGAKDSGVVPMGNELSDASFRAEYYLQRLYVQMGKNLEMMGILLHEMTRPDFPRRVCAGGAKIADNVGPTAERTCKLMADVWEMWTGSWRGGK